jgi:hypothetical protein
VSSVADTKRTLDILAGVLTGVVGVAFAVGAGVALAVLVTHTYRFKLFPVMTGSIAFCVAVISLIRSRRLIFRRRLPT